MIKIKKSKCLLNPEQIIPSSKKLRVLGVFNPAAVRAANGDIILYARVLEKLKEEKEVSPRMVGKESFKVDFDRFDKEKTERSSELDIQFKDGTKRLKFISHLRRVILDKTGFNIKRIDKKPSFYGLAWDGELGIEDPRITKIGDLYVMTYVSLSREGNISTSYAVSNDCIRWYRRGIIFGEQDKDVVLFSERIKGKYIAFDRPEGSFQFTPPHIWISYSEDMEYWGDAKAIKLSKENEWDYTRVGAGPPPLKTDKGWLLFYHIASDSEVLERFRNKIGDMNFRLKMENPFQKIPVYCVGAALFDLKNPKKLKAKTDVPLIIPEKRYEKGEFENKRVIFPTGVVLDENKKDLLLYSGGGDKVVSVKKIALKDVFSSLKEI